MTSTRYLTRQTPGIEIKREYYEDWYVLGDVIGPAWKLDVGEQCNLALEQVESMKSAYPNNKDYRKLHFERMDAIAALVDRVANFEELEVE